MGQLGYNHDIISCRASCRPLNGRFPQWEHSEESVDVGDGATFRDTNEQLPPRRVGLSSSLVPFFQTAGDYGGGDWVPPTFTGGTFPLHPGDVGEGGGGRCVLAKYNLAHIQCAQPREMLLAHLITKMIKPPHPQLLESAGVGGKIISSGSTMAEVLM